MDYRLLIASLLWGSLVAIALRAALIRTSDNQLQWKVCLLTFGIVLAAALPVWRLKSLLYDGEINVDESQLLSQAMRYAIDPLPWRSVDGGSSGPLNTWVVLWAPLFGLKFNYLAARITSILCLWSMFMGLALALAELAGRRLALLLLLPALTFVLTTTNLDFAFLSSEQLPSAISAWVIYLIARQLRAPSRWAAYGIGLLTGALPFCKIQIGPAAVLLFLAAAVVLWTRFGASRNLLRWLLVQSAGGLSVPALILIPVALGGAWNEFFQFYIHSALSYKNTGAAMPAMDVSALFFSVREFGFLSVLSGLLTIFALSAAWLNRRAFLRQKSYLWTFLLSFIYLILVAGSILKTGYPFPHYLMFLIVPSVTLLGVSFIPLHRVQQVHEETAPKFNRLSIAGLCVVLTAIFVQASATVGDLVRNPVLRGNWGSGLHPIGEVIRKLVNPGDSIAIWGWAPKFCVMSQTPPAFRFSQSLFFLDESPAFQEVRGFYLDRFLNDLEKSRPKLFIDAPDEFMWPGYPHGIMARHWALPVLSEFVRKNYSLLGSIESPPGKTAIMIYRRKEDGPN